MLSLPAEDSPRRGTSCSSRQTAAKSMPVEQASRESCEGQHRGFSLLHAANESLARNPSTQGDVLHGHAGLDTPAVAGRTDSNRLLLPLNQRPLLPPIVPFLRSLTSSTSPTLLATTNNPNSRPVLIRAEGDEVRHELGFEGCWGAAGETGWEVGGGEVAQRV